MPKKKSSSLGRNSAESRRKKLMRKDPQYRELERSRNAAANRIRRQNLSVQEEERERNRVVMSLTRQRLKQKAAKQHLVGCTKKMPRTKKKSDAMRRRESTMKRRRERAEESLFERYKRLEEDRLRKQESRNNETEEEKEIRRFNSRQRTRKRRAMETPEETEKRKFIAAHCRRLSRLMKNHQQTEMRRVIEAQLKRLTGTFGIHQVDSPDLPQVLESVATQHYTQELNGEVSAERPIEVMVGLQNLTSQDEGQNSSVCSAYARMLSTIAQGLPGSNTAGRLSHEGVFPGVPNPMCSVYNFPSSSENSLQSSITSEIEANAPQDKPLPQEEEDPLDIKDEAVSDIEDEVKFEPATVLLKEENLKIEPDLESVETDIG